METTHENVHVIERRASTLLGGALLLHSFTRRSLALGEMVLAGTLLYRGISGHSMLYQTLGVNTAELLNGQRSGQAAETPEFKSSITVEKPVDELYRFWQDPQNLSLVMEDNTQVTPTASGHMHWIVEGPLNRSIEWDTQVVEERPNELIRWRSVPGATIPSEGWVRFRPAPRDWGTEVTLGFSFDVPGGALGNKAGQLLGFVPRILVEQVLRRFKSLAETGEFPTLKRNPAARPMSHAQA